MAELYLPDDTITAAERVTLEYLRTLMQGAYPEFPVKCCADTAALVQQVLNWPLVAVDCLLQTSTDGTPFPHAVNSIPQTGNYVDMTLQQFCPSYCTSDGGTVVTQDPKLGRFLDEEIPEIAILPCDTPIFAVNKLKTLALKCGDTSPAVRDILDALGLRSKRLDVLGPLIWKRAFLQKT